jgi:hypothetical protein
VKPLKKRQGIKKMIKAKRRNRYKTFPLKTNLATSLILGCIFLHGLILSFKIEPFGLFAYLVLWVVSYFIIYAGTCRNCVYYGKRCPVPLEGSCVNRFFKKGEQPFGYFSLIAATLAYLFRVAVPIAAIALDRMLVQGSVYIGLLILFWVIHLRVTGCPNCVNESCPLNPDYGQ